MKEGTGGLGGAARERHGYPRCILSMAREWRGDDTLTAFLVDVLGALRQGDNLVAGEHPGLVRLLSTLGTEGLIAGVAEIHGV